MGGGGRGAVCLLPFILSFCLHILRKRERTIKRDSGEEGEQTNYLFGKLLLFASKQTTRLHGLSLMERK